MKPLLSSWTLEDVQNLNSDELIKLKSDVENLFAKLFNEPPDCPQREHCLILYNYIINVEKQ